MIDNLLLVVQCERDPHTWFEHVIWFYMYKVLAVLLTITVVFICVIEFGTIIAMILGFSPEKSGIVAMGFSTFPFFAKIYLTYFSPHLVLPVLYLIQHKRNLSRNALEARINGLKEMFSVCRKRLVSIEAQCLEHDLVLEQLSKDCEHDLDQSQSFLTLSDIDGSEQLLARCTTSLDCLEAVTAYQPSKLIASQMRQE